MKTQISILFILYLISSNVILKAQDLHVFYDAHTKELTYQRNGISIEKPKVKKGESIVFRLHNFNNFLYSAKVESNAEQIQLAGTPLSLINTELVGNGGSQGIKGLLPFNFSAATGINETKDISFDGYGYGSDVEMSSNLKQMKSSLDFALQEMRSAEKQLKFVDEDVDDYLTSKAVNKIIIQELNNLKTNPRLQPMQIKKLSLEYLEKIFNKTPSKELSLDEIIKNADSKQLIKGLINEHNKAAAKYNSGKSQLTSVAEKFKMYEDDEDVQTLKKTTTKLLAISVNSEMIIEKNKKRLEELYAHEEKKDLQELVALRYEYEAIANNDFAEVIRIPAEGDLLNIKIKLIPKNGLNGGNNLESIVHPEIKIPVYGGIKINTSMGISFGKFLDQPNTFFIQDSIVGSQPKDKFTPLITSFLHFYPQSRGQVSFGGSFGIGIPINGENALSSISFLLGPSMIIGKSESIVISAGIMGSKIEKLAKGFQIGDRVANDALALPMYSSYELGYYIGLSFNLFKK